MADIFGPIFVDTTLETAAMNQFDLWMPTYIQEIEIQLGRTRGQIPPPKQYATRNEFTSFPADLMPMCIVVSPGLDGEPTAEGDGTYSAWFQLGVGFAAAARDAEASGFLARVYGAAGRKILLDRQSIGGVAHAVQWVDHSNDDLVTEDERTIRASYDIFRVHIWNVVTRGAGPAAPAVPNAATQPGSQWPTANTVKINSINLKP